MVEEASMSETSVNFFQNTGCNVPEDSHFIMKSTAVALTQVLHMALGAIADLISILR
jgi:hypothetical protein